MDANDQVEDFEIRYANKPANATINHPKGKLNGLYILRDGVPSMESAPSNFLNFLKVYQSGEENEFVFYAHHAHRQIETKRMVYEGGVLSTTRDRKAQREAEQKEQEKTLLLDGIISHAPIGIQVYEAMRDSNGDISDFKIKLYNDVLHSLTRVTEEERRRLTFRQLLKLLESEDLYARYLNAVEKDAPFAFDYYSPRIKGWLHISVVKLGDGFLIMLTDITQVKESQQLLQEQSNYLSSILNTSINAIVTLQAVRDDKGSIVDMRYKQVNRQFLEWQQISEEAVIDKTMLEVFPNTKEAGIYDVYREVIETGLAAQVEIHYHNGENIMWYDLSVSRLDADTAVGNFNDITNRKSAQDLAAQQTSLLDNILTHSSNGISVGEMIRDASGNIIDIKTIMANDAAVKFTGIPKETYLNTTAAEVDPTFIGSIYHQMCIKCMETGEPFITQYYLASIGAWLEVTVSKMDDDRQIYIFTDVTTIKESQLALERSSERLSTVINTTQAGFFMGSPVQNELEEIIDFRFTLINQVMASFVEDEPQNLIGKLGSERFVKYKTNGLFERFRAVYLTGKQQQFDFHYMGATVDVWVNIMITRIGDEILGTFTDITQIKTLQLQLEQNIADLKRSNAYLGEFAHAASHDLKEPIRKIHTFAERLRSSLHDRMTDLEAGLFERMQMAAKRMNMLVEDLLTYSQVSETPLQMEAVDLNEKLQSVLLDLEVQIEEKKAALQAEQLPTVKGYRRQLQQLFQNLIGNALKYSKKDMPPDIDIRFRTISGAELQMPIPFVQTDKRYYLIEVKDNGIGFEQEYADRIFSMFQRLHGRSEYEGTGIGLSIARKVIDNHQGHIWAEAKPGEGATFRFILPQD